MSKDLSQAQCILLTIHYASESNIKALHSFTPTRLDALDPELVLRILLTYLPESLEPREYTTYVGEVASRLYLDVNREDVEVDVSPVKDIDEAQAKKKVKKLKLLEIKPPSFPAHAPNDILIRFLCHRAYRIDVETGLLNLVPQLIEPFLVRHDFLRTWYISVVLPLLRCEFEYHPGDDTKSMNLVNFERLEGSEGIDFLMHKAAGAGDLKRPRSLSQNGLQSSSSQKSDMARDIKGLVGPWMYGGTERKRRKLGHEQEPENATDDVSTVAKGMRKIALDGTKGTTGHDWEYLYIWMVHQAQQHFSAVSQAIEDWDGPGDVDLGGFSPGNSNQYLEEDVQSRLEARYAQAAFASCYAVQADTEQAVHGAHGILARLAELLDFVPPPDLATSVESLPKMERHATQLAGSHTDADIAPDALLRSEHPLTTPRLETYMLLQMMVYSAYQFSGLGHPISIIHVAKLHFYGGADEQLQTLQRILHGLSNGGARKDDTQWTADRAKLMWLWNWGIDADDQNAQNGPGVLGNISKQTFEKEMLKCFTDTSCYDLAIELYLKSSSSPLPRPQVEQTLLGKAMEAYDSASNGNKTRGGVKKAIDILNTFRPYLNDSVRFRRAVALISATHALSFYSLTLQHGVPFQPVNIRVSQDPLGLISEVLEQNPRSYTKLDDLIGIGRNLVSAGLPQHEGHIDFSETGSMTNSEELESLRRDAERRVTLMAIEAALREDDFETAYSYIVSRLTPSASDIEAPKNDTKRNTSTEDDVSWRAAFLAGRYRPASSSPPTIRRLEQRTELLSLALLLAPVSALTDILAAWRRCEEETTSLQLSQQQIDEEFDDRADKRQSTSSLPGNFTMHGEQPAMVLNQKRREMGRMTGNAGGDAAPMSMFDLTRSAAQAFSKNAFPLRDAAARSLSGNESTVMEASTVSLNSDSGIEGQQRVRKRDMVASAVSGGLASGLGWVLGAGPADRQPQ